jgi:hypothetical protein
MTYAEQLTAQLRQAHITSLRQRYLDLIEEARIKREESERSYLDEARQAYINKRKGFKNTPQKLSALGISGGRSDSELASIIAEYEDVMAKLKRRRNDLVREYDRVMQEQTRLMNNSINEYNARTALEDYSASQKRSSGGSKSSGSGGGAADKQQPAETPDAGSKNATSSTIWPDIIEYMSNFGYRGASVGKKIKY